MAAAEAGLLFRIRADSSQAKAEISSLRGIVSREIGEISTSFASGVPVVGGFAAALGPVGIGLAVVGSAAIAAAAGIFALAKNASDAGSKIFDLSRNTGISAETLSALKVAADQSGSSLEEVVGGLTKFNRLIGEAVKGSKEATATLKRFGIEPKAAIENSREALAKVVKTINDLPPGAARAIAAQQAFGRSGANLVSTLESVGGNLDEFIQKAKELGVVIDDEAAAAADDFGDKLTQLETRISGIAQTIGRRAIPEILLALNSLDAGLAQNQNSWANWAGEVARAAVAASSAFASAVAGFGRFGISGVVPGIIASLSESSEAQYRRSAGLDKPPPVVAPPAVRSGGGGGGGKRRGGGGKAAVVDSNQLEITRREQERFYKEQEEIAQRSYERQLRTIEEFTAEQISVEQRRLAAFMALAIEERAAITEKGEARRNKEREIDDRIAAERQESNRKIIGIIDDGAREAEKIEEARRERNEENARAIDDLRLTRIANDIENRVKTESEGEKEITEIRVGAIDREIADIEYLMTKVRAGSAEYIKLQGDLAAAESRRVAAKEEGTQRVINAIDRETQKALQQGIYNREAEIQSEREDPSSGRSIFGDVFADATNEGASNMEAFGDTVRSVLGSISDSAGNVKTMMGDLFAGIAQGVGSGIKSFILLGNFGAAGLRKFAAEAIASVAAQAAVKAIFEVAEGFAALARFDPVSAAAHFSAAKFYGILAGVAAVAGRAVAGTAFANDAKPAPLSAGSAGTNQSSRPEDRTVRETRGAGAPQVIIIRLEPGLIGEKAAEEIRNNGPLRNVIVETARG